MAENIEKSIEQLNSGIKNMQESISKRDKDVDSLLTKHDELSKQLEGLAGIPENFKTQQEHLDQLSTELKKYGERMETKENHYEIIEKGLKGEDFKGALKVAKNMRSGGNIFGIDIKAAGDITTADINSGSIRTEYEPGVAKHPWRRNPLYDRIPKGVVGEGRDSISWWEEQSRVDSAEWVDENAAPTAKSSADWVKQSLDVELVKDYTKVSVSALEDWEYTRSEAVDLINNGIPRAIEKQLFDGTDLTGLIGQAKAFAKPANFSLVASPNHIDAIRAVATQIMNGNTSDSNKAGYMPNFLFVNPGTMMDIRNMKDANNGYIIPPLGAPVMNIDGIEMVPSLDLDADEFLMCDLAMAKIYMKRMMRLSFHYENEDDALKDLVMIMASVRLAGVKVATPHTFAFVTGTFSAVKTAITKPVA